MRTGESTELSAVSLNQRPETKKVSRKQPPDTSMPAPTLPFRIVTMETPFRAQLKNNFRAERSEIALFIPGNSEQIQRTMRVQLEIECKHRC